MPTGWAPRVTPPTRLSVTGPTLYLGVATQLQIQVLTERYADYGRVGFLVWWRGDVQVARPAAFDVTTGVRP
jgi:hypothetical protein